MRAWMWLMRILLLVLVVAACLCYWAARSNGSWQETAWSCCGSNICLQQRMHVRVVGDATPVELPPTLQPWMPRCSLRLRVATVNGQRTGRPEVIGVICEPNKGLMWFDARTGREL